MNNKTISILFRARFLTHAIEMEDHKQINVKIVKILPISAVIIDSTLYLTEYILEHRIHEVFNLIPMTLSYLSKYKKLEIRTCINNFSRIFGYVLKCNCIYNTVLLKLKYFKPLHLQNCAKVQII